MLHQGPVTDGDRAFCPHIRSSIFYTHSHTHTRTWYFHTSATAVVGALSRPLSRQREVPGKLLGKVGVICLLKKQLALQRSWCLIPRISLGAFIRHFVATQLIEKPAMV